MPTDSTGDGDGNGIMLFCTECGNINGSFSIRPAFDTITIVCGNCGYEHLFGDEDTDD